MDLLEYLSQQIAKAPNSYKRIYRKDMVKALINSYPEGTPIRGKEFTKALQYSPNSTGGTTLNLRLIQRGEISRKLINNPGNVKDRLYTYKVLVPGNTYDKERELATTEDNYDDHKPQSVKVEQSPTPLVPRAVRTYTLDELEALAMKYQFYSDGHGTVSGFLTYLKGE